MRKIQGPEFLSKTTWKRLLNAPLQEPRYVRATQEETYDCVTQSSDYTYGCCLQGSVVHSPELYKFSHYDDIIEKMIAEEWRDINERKGPVYVYRCWGRHKAVS